MLPDDEIAARIADGLIPPRPSFVHEPDAWRRWYDEHVRCVVHQYALRERGSTHCAECAAKAADAIKAPKRKPRGLL